MSDVPAKSFSPPLLRVSDAPNESKPTPFAPRRQDAATFQPPSRAPQFAPRPSLIVIPPPVWTFGRFVGFLILVAGVVFTAMSLETWNRLVWWAPQSWMSTESYRWMVAGALIVAGLLFVTTRALAVVLTSIFCAATLYCADRLLNDRMAHWLEDVAGPESPRYALAISAIIFGYWVQAAARGTLKLRGVFGLALTLVAAFGTFRGWYDWSPIAGRLGPTLTKVLKEQGPECTWATVLVLTALGVASSRSRPIHFLIAVLLGALAYHCVRDGYYELHTFPELSKGDTLVSCESMSYSNVELWRWIVAAELTLLAGILLHLAVGLGGLSMAMAIGWMITGLALYHSVGSMSLIRTAFNQHEFGADPLANMGIPLAPASPKASGPVAVQANRPIVATLPRPASATSPTSTDVSVRRAFIREIAPMTWMIFTAALAGVIAVCGFNLMADGPGHRSLFNSIVWFAFGAGLTTLIWIWPRDPDRSWTAWLASARMSRYHFHSVWLMFLGMIALVSLFSIARPGRPSTWVHLGAAAAFVGTAASLATIAILIYFGGFSPLPAWTYIVVAVIQSSLGWILLSGHTFMRTPSPRRIQA